MLFEAEKAITITDCINSKPIYLTNNAIGEENTRKVVMFIIWNYQKSLHLPQNNVMDDFELAVCASDFVAKFSYDSITDLIFALKQARQEGKVFYNKFSQQDFFEVVNKHFDKKSQELELENRNCLKPTTIAFETLKAIECVDKRINNEEITMKERNMMEKVQRQIERANAQEMYFSNLPEEIKIEIQQEEKEVLKAINYV